jgi:hypothetical protein
MRCAMDDAMSNPVQTNGPQSPADATPMKRGQSAQAQRDKRSKAALKANMARRKAQVRARSDPEDHGDPEEHGNQETAADQQGDNETSQDAGPDARSDTGQGTPETGQQAE